MHELGNIYHLKKNTTAAYKHWNEALDNLLGIKDGLIKWRAEFSEKDTHSVDTSKLLHQCGIWGCLLGGVLTSKMAQ